MIGLRLQNRYEITDTLGAGAMGEVYLALDMSTSRQVAIKVLPPALARNEQYLRRFEREAKALRELNHPNIVSFIDNFEEDTIHYLVMSFMPGGNLYARIQERGALPIEEVRRIAMDLTDALIRAHRLGIIHRDIKPENILFDEQGVAHLSDFGIAGVQSADLTRGPSMTQGQIGTPYYMSPEAWQGEQQDEQSDIWSLGVVIYEMLVGDVPFGGSTGIAVMRAVVQSEMPDMRELRQEVPDGIYEIVRRALAKERVQRYQSMRELGADLERGEPSVRLKRSEIAAESGSRRTGLLVAGVVGLVAVVIVAVLILASAGTTEPEPTAVIAAPIVATETSTITATSTPIPSETPTPSTPQVEAKRLIAIHAGPDDAFPVVANLELGERLDLIGLSEDGGWYRVVLPDGSMGWVRNVEIFVSTSGNINAASIVTLTPSATPTFTPTDTPTATATTTPSETPTVTASYTPSLTATRTPIPLPTVSDVSRPTDLISVEPCNWQGTGTGFCILSFSEMVQSRILTDADIDWSQISRPGWSPDGTQLVFSAVRPGEFGGRDTKIFIVNADGTDLQPLPVINNDISPSWSPDGQWLAYHSGCDLALMRPDGSESMRLWNSQSVPGCIFSPQWSPDSKAIVSVVSTGGSDGNMNATNREIWIFPIEGGDITKIATMPFSHDEFGRCDNSSVVFDSSGKKVAYFDETCIPLLANADGTGEPERLNEFPEWWTSWTYPQWGGLEYAPDITIDGVAEDWQTIPATEDAVGDTTITADLKAVRAFAAGDYLYILVEADSNWDEAVQIDFNLDTTGDQRQDFQFTYNLLHGGIGFDYYPSVTEIEQREAANQRVQVVYSENKVELRVLLDDLNNPNEITFLDINLMAGECCGDDWRDRDQIRNVAVPFLIREPAPIPTATPMLTPTPILPPTATPLPEVGVTDVFVDEFDRDTLGDMYDANGRWTLADGLLVASGSTVQSNLHFRFADVLNRFAFHIRFRFTDFQPTSDEGDLWIFTHQNECGQAYIFHMHNPSPFLTGNPCSQHPEQIWDMLDQNPDFSWQADRWYDLMVTVDAPIFRLSINGKTILENTEALSFDPLKRGSLNFTVHPAHSIDIDRIVIGSPEKLVGEYLAGTITEMLPGSVMQVNIDYDALLSAGLDIGDTVLVAINGVVTESTIVDDLPTDIVSDGSPVISVAGQFDPVAVALNRANADEFYNAEIGDKVVFLLPD